MGSSLSHWKGLKMHMIVAEGPERKGKQRQQSNEYQIARLEGYSELSDV
jgi:hypothetical protein